MTAPALIEVNGLTKHFPVGGELVRAVEDVSFAIRPGETLGLVGESGCGKSTVGRMILRLLRPTSGSIAWGGRPVEALEERTLRPLRRGIQAVFQDPYSSLNPRMTTAELITEPLAHFAIGDRAERQARAARLIRQVGLPADAAPRRPHEFSGGQRQRIAIARALAPEPTLIVCDEAVSALDVSVKAQIVNLLRDLQSELGQTYLFISHDLAIVERISAEVAVMYLGRIVEIAPTRKLYAQPAHPYTRALLASVPAPDPALRGAPPVLEGEVPSPRRPPPGCAFHTRCPRAEKRCREERPALAAIDSDRRVACHYPV